MFKIFSSKPKAVRSTTAFTLESRHRMRNQEMRQLQRVTEHYVLNDIGGRSLAFLAENGERYTVDFDAKTLKALVLPPQQAMQVAAVRQMMGDVRYEPAGEDVEMNGFVCRRFTISVESPQIVVSGEVYTTRVPGMERTALAAERAADAKLQPFSFTLAPDEVVVRSVTKVLAAGSEQNQELDLLSVTEGVDDLEAADAITGFKRID